MSTWRETGCEPSGGYGEAGTGGQAGQPLPAGAYEVRGGLVSARDSAAFAATGRPVLVTVTAAP